MNQPLGAKQADILLQLQQQRGAMVVQLLAERREARAAIESAGGIAATDGALAVRGYEQRLRDIDEALGILRFGS